MSDVAIKVEGLGKRYALGAEAPYATLRETIGNLMRLRSSAPKPILWAINDVSFTVKQGETVGIIGRNGAGKSTLLKMLSRITTPTAGRIEVTGRMASLLEVGTGFHPELTGRENVFLNGGILGMTRPEIRARFDEIVAFAEVDRFVDTAVKHYSSGMYLRLAFAVAAHLEPEILIVDEVLAVGDASFQRKCLSKMEDAGKGGRTVIFVSHNMPAVTRLCGRTILLDRGTVLKDGPSHEVVTNYLRSGLGTTAHRAWSAGEGPGNEWIELHEVMATDANGTAKEYAEITQPVGLRMRYTVKKPGLVILPNFHVLNDEGQYVFVVSDSDREWSSKPRPAGEFTSTAWIPGNLLAEGTLLVGAALSTLEPTPLVHCFERDAVGFQVVDKGAGDSVRGSYGGPIPGVIRPLLNWTTQFVAPVGKPNLTVENGATP